MKNTLTNKAATILMLALLSGCTMYHGSNAYLPDRSGIQEGQTITVGNNENIYTVAKKYNVSMRELISLNSLKPPFEIRPGQSLMLPAGGTSFGGNMPPPEAAPLAPVERNSLSPVEHAPVSSESLAPLAAPAAVPMALPPPSPSSATTPTSLSPTSLAPPKPAPQSSLSPSPVATTDLVQALNHAAAAHAQTATTMSGATGAGAAAAAATAPEMVWPVQGPIVSGYGAKGAGMANDGVNISAPKGSPVVAAAPGTVVYAGDEMKGFGNLVLIRHEGDWVTAYAHLDRVLVKKDTVVAQGDEIGTVGKTGNAASPQVHFEVRQGGKAIDPASVIKSAG